MASISVSPTERNAIYASDEWTASSLVIGGLMTLTAPMTCILSAVTWAHADHSPSIVSLFAWSARGAVAVVVVLLLMGLSFGRIAIRQAKASGRSSVLASTALYVNVAASLLWIATAAALLSTTESLLHQFGR